MAAIKMLPRPNGIWYSIEIIVLLVPPNTSMHMTKDVTLIPPSANPDRNFINKNAKNQGVYVDIMLATNCNVMVNNRIFFLPNLSDAKPKNTLPTN